MGLGQRRRIPKILHQTGRTTTLSYVQVQWRGTWSYHNPQYELRFYDDAGCHDFVAHEYPGACSRLHVLWALLHTEQPVA
jgi:mannosyltransferase OCH1-like enzyme